MSTPVRCLTLDERDELYQGDPLGKQPWSAVELARQRLNGQTESFELNLSTPTIPGHGINAEFERSDQHHFHLFCPHCRRHVVPAWPESVGDGGLGEIEKPAAFLCPGCRTPWTADERRVAVRDGIWIARYPERSLRGYHLTQMTAPAADPGRILRQWRASENSGSARQVFFNAVLGLPYLAEGARLERRFLDEAILRGGYPMAKSSQGGIMGIDVGPTWLHTIVAEVVAQAGGDELRIVWAGKLPDWEELSRAMRRFRVQSYVIDAMPETHQVRNLLGRFPCGYMCYYRVGGAGQVDAVNRIIHTPRTESLDAMYQRWRNGKIAAPANLPVEFADQMTALARVLRIGGDGQARADYQEAGGPDHFAHAMNYCELALKLHAAPARFEVTLPGGKRIEW